MGKKAHIILFGNQKGGSGKSTAAVHCAVGMLRLGFKVASIDLDASQQTMTRYFDNRSKWIDISGAWMPMPTHAVIPHSDLDSRKRAEQDVAARLGDQIDAFRGGSDFIIIDTPGADDFLSRAGHIHADTLVTPVNDSFLDLDLLVTGDTKEPSNAEPSHYAKLVMHQRQKRFTREKQGMDWIVLRNRLSPIQSGNNARVGEYLQSLSGLMGFRLVPGISERVIYRELFPEGRTVLDLASGDGNGGGGQLSMSHLAARQEARELLKALWLPMVDGRMKETVSGG